MKIIDFLTILLVLGSNLFQIEARRLNTRFLVNAVRSGQSPSEGHKYTNFNTLGGMENSDPIPDQENKLTNVNMLVGIKDSGPSPGGDGHRHRNANMVEGTKNSIAIPSPGAGNKYTIANTLIEIKESVLD
ncbi:hypothetical protein CASFOL_018115 [Castilleja foliolosa]|uniref:Uncharacterized protein n=1 Tax=Castilleja foliolosa TaxID=1961234 RepID=A0ABD3DA81_9LAMI